MSLERHIADAETAFVVLNVTPDFCRVGAAIVPFDICQILPPERAQYATSVFARSEKVLMVDSLIAGVLGNAGQGVGSTVSLGAGHSRVMAGATSVFIESRMAARHDDLVEMNGMVAG
ncbi:MAG TPA: PAAR-like domain-containing protein [Burkholderiaceae bacterium]